MPHNPQPAPPPAEAAGAPATDQDPEVEQYWHDVLTGKTSLAPMSRLGRALFRHLPSEPRCKWCYAPYGKPFGPVIRRLGYGPWESNPALCGKCLDAMEKMQGGAEVEVAVMFADLRGSTQMAARMTASAYRGLLNTYYGIVAAAVQAPGGIVDKYLGDGVLALFLRGYCDADPVKVAVTAGQHILREVQDHAALPPDELPLPVGIGLHSGVAYVGIVGQPGLPTDFTALGDAVNVAERVSSSAGAGELLVSDDAWQQLAQKPGAAQQRELTLKGVAQPVQAWSMRPGEKVETAAAQGDRERP